MAARGPAGRRWSARSGTMASARSRPGDARAAADEQRGGAGPCVAEFQGGTPSVQLSQFVREPGARADTVSFSYLLLCALAFLLSVVPIIGNTHPPLYDYPFYIARLFILSSMDGNPFIFEHYTTSSFLIPNIALEMIGLPLATFLPYETVLDVLVLLICALSFTGTIFLHHTLFGRPSLWPLITACLCHQLDSVVWISELHAWCRPVSMGFCWLDTSFS